MNLDDSESDPIYLPKEGSFSLNLGAPLRPEPTLWSIEDSDHWVDEMGDVDEFEVESREHPFPITNDQHISMSLSAPSDVLVR
ncbi:hypothetical protein N7528_009014 [Penicillium herquei]|nr:hypothetical protein N7528_009014 [Penicillium herquei]